MLRLQRLPVESLSDSHDERRAMSRRSKRTHRQQGHRSHAPSLGHTALKAQKSHGVKKGRALLIGVAVLVIAGVLYAVTGSGGRKGEVAARSGPKIVFATPVYDFGKVKSGEIVKYTYVFTNVGGAMLQVSNVQVSCGCTTAGEWSRQVEPGKIGSIPIQFNSTGFGGAVGKTITVISNDTNQPSVVLQIKGNIWRPIDVTPQFAVLNLTASAPSNATTVRIVNNEETPLTLSTPECNNQAFATELRTNQPGKEFEMVIRTASPLAASVQAPITLKTSSTNMPVINITAWANMQQEIMVMPSQISLSTAPLTSAMSTTVSIRNTGTNTLTLSEPTVNDKKVDLQLREIEAGRFFTLTANFPIGFEVAQGQPLELSLKSNHPQFPIIKVPVVQPARPSASNVPQRQS